MQKMKPNSGRENQPDTKTPSPSSAAENQKIEGITPEVSSTEPTIEETKDQPEDEELTQETLENLLRTVDENLEKNIKILKTGNLKSADKRLTQVAIDNGKQSRKELLMKIQKKTNIPQSLESKIVTIDITNETNINDPKTTEQDKQMFMQDNRNADNILAWQSLELKTTKDLIIAYREAIHEKDKIIKDQNSPKEMIDEAQSELKKFSETLKEKEELRARLEKQIILTKDDILRKEIGSIGIQLAITSDATKDKNITEDTFSELKKEIEKLENKKEELTQKLSYFDPDIAAQFRTSTPINEETPMETEDNLRRKRTATSPELNRSFSESDLSQTAKKLKDGSITSFLTSASKFQLKTGKEGLNQASNSRRNSNQINSNPNSQPQSRKSSITSMKTPKKLKTNLRQEDTQITPSTKTQDDLEKTSTQNNQQQIIQLTNSTKEPN